MYSSSKKKKKRWEAGENRADFLGCDTVIDVENREGKFWDIQKEATNLEEGKAGAYTTSFTIKEAGISTPVDPLITREVARPLSLKEENALAQSLAIVMPS